jgi:type I restriction enzyme R subunit
MITESLIEQAALECLQGLGYATHYGPDIGPDATDHRRERASYGDVVLLRRLREAVARLNPDIPMDARDEAIRKVIQTDRPTLVEENRRLHKLMVNGVELEYLTEEGQRKSGIVRLVDLNNPDANDWLAVNQFTVVENRANRRPDVVVFVNGLPLGVIELKNAGDENADITGAYHQLQTYKKDIPSLFRTNGILITSDGLHARIGSLTADLERFMPWRTVDGSHVAPKGQPEMDTLLRGVFEKRRLLSLLRDFVVFAETGRDVIKILAGYHQFHAVRHAVENTIRAIQPEGNRKVGVIWHTQGSGKSLLMAFYAGQIIKSPAMTNPTLVVLTDRNDLDDQLFSTFGLCKELIRQEPIQVASREHLRTVLNREVGGVVFTTIQKFAPDAEETAFPMLTDRRNVIVVADEAHRSQYGFEAKVDPKTGKISYGFAKHLRDALPNASFIGFTGTPIESSDVSTPAVFGDYIDVYDITRAVEDGATVPIFYESRLARIELPEEVKAQIDEDFQEATEADEVSGTKNPRWSAIEALVGSENRVQMVAKDLVEHFENRLVALDGKAMIVCMSRRICVEMYNAIVALRPEWHSDDDNEGVVKVVMTGAASDKPEWQPHIGSRPKARRELLAKRAKAAKDPLKIVIVRDMWLTGFDAPAMHTMYIDKPMYGHNLMQSIARVNRVFKDKPAGLVVDYIGIAQNLKEALSQYSDSDQKQAGIDEKQAIAVLMTRYDVVCSMYHGFDYQKGLYGTAQERLFALAGAIEWVLEVQQKDAEAAKGEEAKKKARRRYDDEVTQLSKAFALASASDEAKKIRDEVGFFQTVRAALAKNTATGTTNNAERDFAIQQIVNRSVVSTEIVDILKAAGLKSPDISILSDEFLLEVKGMERKNLALEALKKLLNDEIRSRSRTNIIESRTFSERLESAINRYHTNAITTVEILEELLKIAKDMRESLERGDEMGLTQDEVAFYTALAANNSAVEMMGDDKLRLIAHELVVKVKGNLGVDWVKREDARAKIRVLVKKILRQYGYPPDLQDSAVQAVLQQAEGLAAIWSQE